MKHFSLCFLFLVAKVAFPQKIQDIDSLRHELRSFKQDTNRVMVLIQLCIQFRGTNSDSAKLYGQQALTLAREINYTKGEMRAMTNLGFVILDLGNLPKALQLQLKVIQLADKYGLLAETARPLNQIGSIYRALNDYNKALSYFQKARYVFESLAEDQGAIGATIASMNIGDAFEQLNRLDSAEFYAKQAHKKIVELGNIRQLPLVLNLLGRIEAKKGNTNQAVFYYQFSIQAAIKNKDHRTGAISYCQLAEWYKQHNQPDSCVYYAQQGLKEARLISYRQFIMNSCLLLSEMYQLKNDFKQAFYYQKQMISAKDSLYGAGNIQALQQMVTDEQARQREVDQAQSEYQSQLRQYALLAGLAVLFLIAFFLYRNNRQKQRANQLLNEQKTKVEQTLETLKATQTQLIQREKMASLGELTAGIAHEIQNPLNFVNNFSEVSVELIEEQKDALAKGDSVEAAAIADDLVENLQRITQNGQRASNIVRGMLEHSRTSTGEHQPTDLNALIDEYLRLAYQGVRAKTNAGSPDWFICQLELDLDPNLPLVNVVAGDISRVLLNLFNNAFYAVGQKQKTAGADYEPTVWVSTRLSGGTTNRESPGSRATTLEIIVRDNGIGIPESIREKIFQPFFTTKPTGEGTGLGLSLSYDIVTKGHGGEMKVESQEGQKTEFVIKLPCKTS